MTTQEQAIVKQMEERIIKSVTADKIGMVILFHDGYKVSVNYATAKLSDNK